MASLTEQAWEMYAGIHPWNRSDTEWCMSEATFKLLWAELPRFTIPGWPAEPPPMTDKLTLFGMRIKQDDSLTVGKIEPRRSGDDHGAARRI